MTQLYYKMSCAIFKIQIKDNENKDLFVLLQVMKVSPSLSWNLTIVYRTVQFYFVYFQNRLVK